jgi:hypothetical protein
VKIKLKIFFFDYNLPTSSVAGEVINMKSDMETKKLHITNQPRITVLFMLRCVQLGISIRDLDLLTMGLVNEMYIESGNDVEKYSVIAGQAEFNAF